jgi:DNA-binding IclR family transcriptional regulator
MRGERSGALQQHADNRDDEDRGMQSGVQAIETGARLLVALARDPRAQMLKTIAAATGMPPAKAHRYLVSFIRTGLVDRDPASGRYRLGPVSLQIGVAALSGVNVVRLASAEIASLRDQTEATVGLAVWSAFGPTFLLVEESSKPVIVKSRPGGVLPILTSAGGRLFAAYLPAATTRAMVDREIAALPRAAQRKAREDFAAILAEVRRLGLSRSLGDFSPGVHGISSPIMDHTGAVVAAITVFAPAGEFDPSIDGPVAHALRAAAARVSRRLGFEPRPTSAGEVPVRSRRKKT